MTLYFYALREMLISLNGFGDNPETYDKELTRPFTTINLDAPSFFRIENNGN